MSWIKKQIQTFALQDMAGTKIILHFLQLPGVLYLAA
jgi:hypothetical protein